MTTPLPEVNQEFHASTAPYVAAVNLATQATEALAAACAAATAAIRALQEAAGRQARGVVRDAMAAAAAATTAASAVRQQAAAQEESAATAARFAEEMARQADMEQRLMSASSRLAPTLRQEEEAAAAATATAAALAEAERMAGEAAAEQARLAAADSAEVTRMAQEMARQAELTRRLAGASAEAVKSMDEYRAIAREVVATQALLAAHTAGLAENDRALAQAQAESAAAAAAAAGAIARAAAAEQEAGAAAAVGQAAMKTLVAGMTEAQRAAIGMSTDIDKITAASIKARLAAVNFVSGASRIGTIIHWLVAGGAEVLAVVVPAMVALGSAMFVAYQGAMNLKQHMTALYAATEATSNMFHVTFGQALTSTMAKSQQLSGIWQRMQDAANPSVYQAFASGLGVVQERFGGLARTGLAVLHIFDGFMARLQYDFSAAGGLGGTVSGLLSRMVPDLVQIGQIFGNLGHAVLNLASKMPGLAQVLLEVADAISRVILWISSLPRWLITSVMAIEEAWRWGGLLATVVSRLAIGLEALGTLGLPVLGAIALRFATMVQSAVLGVAGFLVNLGNVISRIPVFTGAMGKAGTSVERFGKNIAGAAGNTALMGWIGAAAVAAVALAIALDHDRNSAQQFIDTTNKAIASASNLQAMSVITSAIGRSSAMLAQQEHILLGYSGAAQGAGRAIGHWITSLQQLNGPLGGVAQGTLNVTTSQNHLTHGLLSSIPIIGGWIDMFDRYVGGLAEAASKVDQLTVAQRRWVQAAVNATQGAAYLAKTYGTTFTGALALADAAGVKLAAGILGTGRAAVTARMQVAAYVAGWEAMGQPMGAIGTDMTALAIQSGLAATKVSQLNSALDQFVGNLTGGTSNMGALVISLRNIGQVSQSSAGKLAQSTGSMSLSVGQIGRALRSFSGAGAQVWQNFDSALSGSAQQLADWVRTAGAEGAATKQQLAQVILGVASGFEKMASRSATAREQLVAWAHANGMNVTSWKQLVTAIRDGHASMNGAEKAIESITGKMGNMSQIAKNLGVVMQNDLVQEMDKARMSALGINKAFQNFANDLASKQPDYAKMTADYRTLVAKLKGVVGPAQAKQIADQFAHTFGVNMQQQMHGNVARMRVAGTEIVRGVAIAIHNASPSVWSRIGQLAHGIWHGFTSYFGIRSPSTRMMTAGRDLMLGLLNGVNSFAGRVLSWFAELPKRILRAVGNLGRLLWADGANVVSGLVRGIESQAGSVLSAVGHIASLIPSTVAKLLGIRSPSVVMMGLGRDAVAGLVQAVRGGAPQVVAAAAALTGAMRRELAAGTAAAGAAGAAAWSQASAAQLAGLAHQSAHATLRATVPGLPPAPGAAVTAGAAAGALLARGGTGGGGPATVHVHINAEGHVLAEQDLAGMIREVVLRDAGRNWSSFLTGRGRAT